MLARTAKKRFPAGPIRTSGPIRPSAFASWRNSASTTNWQGRERHASPAGLQAIYLSGWQVAGDADLGGQMYPDQSLSAFIAGRAILANATYFSIAGFYSSRGAGNLACSRLLGGSFEPCASLRIPRAPAESRLQPGLAAPQFMQVSKNGQSKWH
jgi:hypothetical protein